MFVGKKKLTRKSVLGRLARISFRKFFVDSIYFSDERIDSDAKYADTVRIIRHINGIRIKTGFMEEHFIIDLIYSELCEIKVFDPDESIMPVDNEQPMASKMLIGWADGLRSLTKTVLRIGGRIEFSYKEEGKIFEVILYHSKQSLFDLFKYVRKHFSDYIAVKD